MESGAGAESNSYTVKGLTGTCLSYSSLGRVSSEEFDLNDASSAGGSSWMESRDEK